MGFVTKNLRATLIASAVIGALVGGYAMRLRADSAGSLRSVSLSSGLLASKDATSEVSAAEYFAQIADLLKHEYVDSVTDDGKLLTGAVRGMVGSLRDPRSFYLAEQPWNAFEAARTGAYSGIGLDFALEPIRSDNDATSTILQSLPPKLVVASVVPGGPADLAGLRAGDWVDSVDGKWVSNGDVLRRFLEASDKFKKKQATNEELMAIRKEYIERADHSMGPARAIDLLILGVEGSVKVGWVRDGKTMSATLNRRATTSKVVESQRDGSIKVKVASGLAEALRPVLDGEPSVTIDLRNNAYGDLPSLEAALALLGGDGAYGFLAGQPGQAPRPLTVEGKGKRSFGDLTLLVDASTRDGARVLARALADAGKATLKGDLRDADALVINHQSLDGGQGGYTMVVGRYQKTAEVQR